MAGDAELARVLVAEASGTLKPADEGGTGAVARDPRAGRPSRNPPRRGAGDADSARSDPVARVVRGDPVSGAGGPTPSDRDDVAIFLAILGASAAGFLGGAFLAAGLVCW